MVYNPNLGNKTDPFRNNTNSTQPSNNPIFARVVDLVLDRNHKDYELFGREDSINGIRYRTIDNTGDEEESQSLPFAFCDQTSLKRVPLLGEIVQITFKPGKTLGDSSYNTVAYYTEPVNIWNNSHHNVLPDPKTSTNNLNLGFTAFEVPGIRNIQPFPGDTYLEGRLGQSLRFSGFDHPKSKVKGINSNGKPYAILKIGQNTDQNNLESYIEDINNDPSSIYITSDQVVPLTPSLVKDQDTYRGQKPTSIPTFQGNQIVIDSGRLVFHAKNDHLLLNSKLSTGIKARSVNIDSTDYIGLDSPKIYLGGNATEPVVRGNKNLEVLNQIVDVLKRMSTNFTLATSPAQASAQLVATGQELLPLINSINLTPTLSTKVFTE